MWQTFWHCAHRGASARAPENTLAAFELALKMGANSMELDVHLSRDGIPVILHDDTLDRTTDGQGRVEAYTLEQLRGLDAGSWFSDDYAGERIPTLEEVIDRARGRFRLNIEIKQIPGQADMAVPVVSLLREKGVTGACVVTSFDRGAIERVRDLAPEIATGLITAEDRPDLLQGDWEAVSCLQDLVDAGWVARVQRAGKRLLVWTVNEAKDMRRLVRLGVDGIITNVPDRLGEVLEAQKNER